VIEVGLVTGYLIAWAMRKGRRAATALDQDVDDAIDAGLNRLNELVSAKLGHDPALGKLQVEIEAAGSVTDRTLRRVDDAVAEAVESDASFADALREVIAELAEHPSSGQAVATGNQSTAVGGDVQVRADHGSAAAFTMGDVAFGAPADPQQPG